MSEVIERKLDDLLFPLPPVENETETVKALAERIRKGNSIEPVQINHFGMVIVGNETARAARLAGRKTVPCVEIIKEEVC